MIQSHIPFCWYNQQFSNNNLYTYVYKIKICVLKNIFVYWTIVCIGKIIENLMYQILLYTLIHS